MFAVKLLANCYIVLNMPSVSTFHISLDVLYYNYNWLLLKSVNGLTS